MKAKKNFTMLTHSITFILYVTSFHLLIIFIYKKNKFKKKKSNLTNALIKNIYIVTNPFLDHIIS